MRFIKVLLLLVLFIVGLMFFVQNSGALDAPLQLQFDMYVNGLKWTTEGVPFYFVVLAAFGVGMLFATILLFFDRIRIGCELLRHKRDVRDLKTEVERLGGNPNNVTKHDKVAIKSQQAKEAKVQELPAQAQPAGA
ncbi:hypothetical protein LJC46_00025 [Desulfovibrio sp. OttesenSCG-928-G15]|nr:hypothetical protein [Desulfovibrio sp. OttesenSCG-928-G15]